MEKRPFIIDCDTGTDDAIAILAALGSDAIRVRALTSVNGNVNENFTSRNNRDLVGYLGADVEVARGAKIPFYPRAGYYDATHGSEGLGDVTLPAAENVPFTKETAPELIRRIAEEEEGRLELLVVGPMTNIAIALSMYPELKEKIRHIWFMGGAALGGNMTPTAEFNIWVDPVAAKLVIASGIPMTMVGLDVTLKAALNREDEQEIRSFGNKGAVLAADILDYMIRRYADGGEDALMHDALAAAAAVCPQCLVCHDYFVDVECQGEYTGRPYHGRPAWTHGKEAQCFRGHGAGSSRIQAVAQGLPEAVWLSHGGKSRKKRDVRHLSAVLQDHRPFVCSHHPPAAFKGQR